MEIEYTTDLVLKEYIQKHIKNILPIFVHYTFDCPNVYYHEEKDTIRYITMDAPINWDDYEFKWTRTWDEWDNSSTLKIIVDESVIPLLEIQFHTTRKNMAIRWVYENFLSVFKKNLTIVDL
jgi:hypothetical protein